jgi:hypothetical protein
VRAGVGTNAVTGTLSGQAVAPPARQGLAQGSTLGELRLARRQPWEELQQARMLRA